MSLSNTSKKKPLGVISLALITIGSVDSIRNLPAAALFGSSLIFFYILGALFFLLPSALIAAELSSSLPQNSGIYSWIKLAFGRRIGFLAVWLQWIENVIWYPAILAAVADTVAYLFVPHWVDNKFFLFAAILVTFWSATIVNLFGIKASAWFANLCASLGLLVPMVLIIILGVIWVIHGHPLQIGLQPHDLWPHMTQASLWVALTGIMLSFCGMEIATVHGQDVDNASRAYPRAMFIATVVILITLLAGSLAVAMVIPASQLSLIAGIMQTFDTFLTAYHLHTLLPLIGIMLIFGWVGGVNNWIIAPTRGLALALQEQKGNVHLTRHNRHQAPQNLLLWQAVIVTIASLAFLVLPSVNGSYWFLTALAAQSYMLMYLFMFIAAIYLRYRIQVIRHTQAFQLSKPLLWLTCGCGVIGSTLTFFISFMPPHNIEVGHPLHYMAWLVISLAVACLLPWPFYYKQRQ